jgi:hypothetical protein
MKSRTGTDGVRASLLPARLPDPADFSIHALHGHSCSLPRRAKNLDALFTVSFGPVLTSPVTHHACSATPTAVWRSG